MVRVPEYQQTVSQRPIFQQGVDVRATPEAFGADIGRGLQQVGQGLSNVSAAVAQVRELEDIARAKEADNNYANWMRERMYGENGYMTLSGRAAVDARAAFEAEAEQRRREFGASLTPGAANAYQTASQARLQQTLQTSIVHAANERKTWFTDASNARIETFANDALVNYNRPELAQRNMLAGIAELRQAGQLNGWDADTLALKEAEFISGVHKNIALRLAQDDPLKADAYLKANSGAMTGAHAYELENALRSEIQTAQSVQEADRILQSAREVPADGPASVAPAGAAQAGRRLADAGPTQARAFLTGIAARGGYSVDNLDEAFATNLAALIQDAPPEIRAGLGITSGFRSHEHQAQLFAQSDGSGRMVARPGNSNHEARADGTAKAVDLNWNGQRLDQAPQHVREWVHANAGKYNMYFPMSWEPWHIEPTGTRGGAGPGSTVVPRNDAVAPRAGLPSYDQIEAQLAGIADPAVRDLTRRRIYATMEAQSRANEEREKAAKASLWTYIDQGMTPDQVPMEVRQAAGMTAVSAAWSYLETAAKGRAVESDQTLLYDMRRYAATDPAEFARIDLNDYRDRLSINDIKELTNTQTTALTDERKAREEGLTITSAFSQAETQLSAVGITTAGKNGSEREASARQIAQFQNVLAAEMEAFKQANNGKAPTQLDVQSMINRLLLPVVVKTPASGGGLFGVYFPGFETQNRDGFLFETGGRTGDLGNGTNVEIAVKYEQIPIGDRVTIEVALEQQFRRKPSPAEVENAYELYLLERK